MLFRKERFETELFAYLDGVLRGAPADQRLYGTIASVTASVMNGAHIVRVHDVKATVEAVKVADVIKLCTDQASQAGALHKKEG